MATNPHLDALLGPGGTGLICRAVKERLPESGDAPVTVPLDERIAAKVERVEHADGACYFLLYVAPPAGNDHLTGLAGRDRLLAELLRLLGRRARRDVQLVMVDLDGFKKINDRHGHVVGDEVLMAVADRLGSTVRPEDLVARWGGDEFVVLLDDPAEEGGAAVCRRVREAFTTPITTRVGPLAVRASCGWVQARDGEAPTELLDRADREMYGEKRRRRRSPRIVEQRGTDAVPVMRGR
ncbi:GGDEF domain-containing protein [Nocardioides caldifontis]|uniref:GGDEF domain-containing protein n=1 Tax=Nocardioides caldifontis TaxID=2588938 RepID=UPI001396BD7B|nr:GGDEF domain-containing protein [Nocardioides caldifontis]